MDFQIVNEVSQKTRKFENVTDEELFNIHADVHLVYNSINPEIDITAFTMITVAHTNVLEEFIKRNLIVKHSYLDDLDKYMLPSVEEIYKRFEKIKSYNQNYFANKIDIDEAFIDDFCVIKKFIEGNTLELGCGTGKVLSLLKDKEKHFGIDVSNWAVEFCKNKGLDVQKFDLVNYEMGENNFDIVYSVDFLSELNIEELIDVINKSIVCCKLKTFHILNVEDIDNFKKLISKNINTDPICLKIKDNRYCIIINKLNVKDKINLELKFPIIKQIKNLNFKKDDKYFYEKRIGKDIFIKVENGNVSVFDDQKIYDNLNNFKYDLLKLKDNIVICCNLVAIDALDSSIIEIDNLDNICTDEDGIVNLNNKVVKIMAYAYDIVWNNCDLMSKNLIDRRGELELLFKENNFNTIKIVNIYKNNKEIEGSFIIRNAMSKFNEEVGYYVES